MCVVLRAAGSGAWQEDLQRASVAAKRNIRPVAERLVRGTRTLHNLIAGHYMQVRVAPALFRLLFV